ncbi:MAG: BamA/TamA family outer membrane protein [Steroidobacteraceae bacterium]
MRSSIPGIIVWFAALLCASLGARAADPQSYRADLASTGDGALDSTLRATSELLALRANAPVSPFGLIARARGDVDRLKTVLESYGYYRSAVTITIEGLGLNNPGVADALTALAKGQNARVAVAFTLGPIYHLRTVSLEGIVPASVEGAFSLKSGAPAVASEVLAAGARLQSALQEQGYAFAKVDPPVAYEDQTQPLLDVSFRVEVGARVNIGDIQLQGLQRVHEKLVRRRLLLRSGQRYSSSAVEAARRDLLSLGPFAAVSVQVGQAVDSTGGVPITFVLRERKRHAVNVNAAFSSDLGGSGGVTWSDRNVFGNAEQLTVAAKVIDLGGSDTTGVGYDTSAKFVIPEFAHRDQSLQFTVGAIKQYLEAYDQKAITSGVTVTRKLSSVWSASAGLATSNEQIIQNQITYDYTLVEVPLSIGYDSTHLASPLDDPTHGMRNSLTVTPTQSLGHPNSSFVITQIKLASYFDVHELGFGDPGRSVLAIRALAGEAQGAGEFSLPPDQRFYAGGSGTIRGYPYQLVGPVFAATDIPVGGTAIAAGSLEFRQRIGANWGAAFFVDGGQVSASLKPLPSDFRVGVGVGVRYYTPIGPIRLDVAVPTKRDTYSNSSNTYDQAFQVYIGLGQAF